MSSSAVARVLALHLWDSGERPDTEQDLARRLKDRVHRALGGEFLSRETLEWFIAAFAMDGADAMALRVLWSGSRAGAVMACEDGVHSFPCRLPPGAVDVAVLRGARVGARVGARREFPAARRSWNSTSRPRWRRARSPRWSTRSSTRRSGSR